MLAGMTGVELAYWQQKARSEFLGDERADWRAGVIASSVANFAGKILPDDVHRSPRDYMVFSTMPPKRTRRVSRKIVDEKVTFAFAVIGQRRQLALPAPPPAPTQKPARKRRKR